MASKNSSNDFSYRHCTKHPTHESFIPTRLLTCRHLAPPFDQDPAWSSMLRVRADDTVKLVVNFTSSDRPEQFKYPGSLDSRLARKGSGTVFWTRLLSSTIPCPLPGCTAENGRPHNVYGPFRVVTVAHLVYDTTEALHTTVEFFDDDPADRSSVCSAQVIDFIRGSEESDRSILVCVTHDARIPERLEQSWQQRNTLLEQLQEPDGASMCVLISHPHGMSKRISIGQAVDVQEYGHVRATEDRQMLLKECKLLYTTPSCPGSGGGSVTLWQRGRRAFAPHCLCVGPERNQSALGWISVSRDEPTDIGAN
ncbi:hypothetical protein ElyMa_006321600 [Elysia marginata]|uniref:Uncharacterized protein n=1 Tax=Elysia marginata TaxID=1093978 RepID=A0AAV4HIB9_9GAST|nr:hypothetical protein ElyMa_006321600 [Elysia marginata]